MTARSPVGLALVGAGPWGRNFIKTIRTSPDARLIAVASRNPGTLGLVDRDCVVVPDWRKAIKLDRVDGVVIATPPHTHAEIALEALASGRGVLIEKPLAMNERDAHAVMAAALIAGERPVMVDHIHLHHPAFVGLRRELQHLGAVRTIRSEAGRTGPFRRDTSVLWDWGAHDVAMALAVTGSDPIAISSRAHRRIVADGTGECVELKFEFERGVEAEIRVSNVLDQPVRLFKVECEHGWALYDSMGPHPLIVQRRHDRPQPVEVEDRRKPLDCAISAFSTALAAHRSTKDDIALGVRVVSVLAACERAMVQQSPGQV